MKPLSDLFDIDHGHSLPLNSLTQKSREDGGVAYVSCKMGGNGISAYIAPIPEVEPSPSGLITCALNGSVLSTFLQEQPFYSSQDIALLRPLVAMTKPQLLFYCYCLLANRYRFNYGRKAHRSLKRIIVPELSEIPAYVDHTDITQYEGCDRPVREIPPPEEDVHTWREFTLAALFDIRKGQRLTKANMKSGSTPYIGASESDNGVTAYVGQSPNHKGGTITVSYNGSVAEAFYQPEPFWATDDVNVLSPKGFELTPEIALFICALIRLEKYRFNYGRKWHMERMRESTIKLPVTTGGHPDWEFMKAYIQSVSYSSQL